MTQQNILFFGGAFIGAFTGLLIGVGINYTRIPEVQTKYIGSSANVQDCLQRNGQYFLSIEKDQDGFEVCEISERIDYEATPTPEGVTK